MSMEQHPSTENHWCVAKCVAVLPSSADPQRRSANVITIEGRFSPFRSYGSSDPLLRDRLTNSGDDVMPGKEKNLV